jgi:hypothetical protein
MTPVRAEHRLVRIVIWHRQLAGSRKAGALDTPAEVLAQIGCEH